MKKTGNNKATAKQKPSLRYYVVFSLTEFITSGAGFWSNEEGWVKEELATRFTKKETQKYRLPLPKCAVWMIAPSCMGLKGYWLRPTIRGAATGSYERFFWAENAEHAGNQANQAQNAESQELNVKPHKTRWRVVSVNGVSTGRNSKACPKT